MLPPFLVEEGDISSTPWEFRQRGFSTPSPQALQAAWIAANTALVLLANSPGARWFPLSLRPNRAKALLTLGPGLAGQCGVEGLHRASCFQESLPVGVNVSHEAHGGFCLAEVGKDVMCRNQPTQKPAACYWARGQRQGQCGQGREAGGWSPGTRKAGEESGFDPGLQGAF